ncbi:MAG: hypothetical protein ACLPX7_27900 [Xanthobacteraceae bacterium]
MQKYLSPLSVASVLSVALYSAALAAPVTSADLSGKKICWNNGSVSSYGSGGKYSNNMTGNGTWSMAGGGVHIHTDRYDYVAAMQKSPDGTFQAVIAAANIKSTGKYCP